MAIGRSARARAPTSTTNANNTGHAATLNASSRYRQVDRPRAASSDEQESALASASEPAGRPQQQPQQPQHQRQPPRELIDVNWHSVSVPSSDSTSLTVQNLSQDTAYEFYVRAKNIIGEGPRSQVVQATTKRAISGSVTPISPAAESVAASTAPNSGE